jgi:hypothetical protein
MAFFKGYYTKKVINDTIYNSAQSQIIKYSYNNIVSTITYRVVKQILREGFHKRRLFLSDPHHSRPPHKPRTTNTGIRCDGITSST